MKWFKHDSDANQDAKLQNVLLDYGLEGYGLYWYCIELIVSKVNQDNLTFELDHDARIIARNVGSTPQKVEEMMRYFISQGLFDHENDRIRCLKLLRRIDKSMIGSRQTAFKSALEEAKTGLALCHDQSVQSHDSQESDENQPIIDGEVITQSLPSHDSVITQSGESHYSVMDKNKTKNKNKRKDISSSGKTAEKNFKYTSGQLKCAKAMYAKITDAVPKAKEPNFESWANDIRLAVAALDISVNEFWRVFVWANADSFWKTNILSPSKLRDKFPQLQVRANEKTVTTGNSGAPRQTETAADRLRARLEAEQNG